MKIIPSKESIEAANRPGPLGDGLARGTEFVGVLVVFLALGWLVDRSFDTKPVFMVVFVVISMIGHFARTWYTYNNDMQRLEAERAQPARSTVERQA